MKVTFRSEIYDRGRATEFILHIDEILLGSAYEIRKLVPKEYDSQAEDRMVDELFYEAKRRVKELLKSRTEPKGE